MSMSPNNPFEDPQKDQGYAWDQNVPPKPKRGKGCLIGCGIAAILGLVVCCGGPVLLVNTGVGALGEQLQRQVANNPAIVEHIGDIQSFEVSWSATIEEAQRTGEQDAGLVFEIKGSEGSGRLLIKGDQGGGGLDSATLILPDDTRIPIDVGELGGGGPEVQELEMDFEDFIDAGDIDTGTVDSGETETIEITIPAQPTETEN